MGDRCSELPHNCQAREGTWMGREGAEALGQRLERSDAGFYFTSVGMTAVIAEPCSSGRFHRQVLVPSNYRAAPGVSGLPGGANRPADQLRQEVAASETVRSVMVESGTGR